MKSKTIKKHEKQALIVEWGGLTAGAYGRPAILALLVIIVVLIAAKFS